MDISDELIRAAVLLPERWCEAIEESSRIYFNENDAHKMIKFLEPLQETLHQPPQTMNEISFYQGYKSDLMEAWEWCLMYRESGDDIDINQAWDIYLAIFRKLSKRHKEVKFYKLQNVSPKLLDIKQTEISVPGLYRND